MEKILKNSLCLKIEKVKYLLLFQIKNTLLLIAILIFFLNLYFGREQSNLVNTILVFCIFLPSILLNFYFKRMLSDRPSFLSHLIINENSIELMNQGLELQCFTNIQSVIVYIESYKGRRYKSIDSEFGINRIIIKTLDGNQLSFLY